LASAREPTVIAFGFLISGSRVQEMRDRVSKKNSMNILKLVKIPNTSS